MYKNFALLLARIIDSNECINYDKTRELLEVIKDSCICIGVGGSQPVSQYASRILNFKNNIIAHNMESRDVFYTNLKPYKNICAFSYSGNNYGIERALEKAISYNLNCYAFTNDATILKNLLGDNKVIDYHGKISREHSYISIASTFMPMSLLLRYYLDGSNINFYDKICDIHSNIVECMSKETLSLDSIDRVEIFSGDFTYTASKILESNMVEAGLLSPVRHEKYSACHGRATLAFAHPKVMQIHLINKRKEIDDMLLEGGRSLYQKQIILNTEETDELIGEYDLALKAMMLSMQIAESLNKDLSRVEYAPQVVKYYKYRGEM